MFKLAFALLAVLLVLPTFADEPAVTKSTPSDDILAKLVDRIDKLEKLVKKLEQEAEKPLVATAKPNPVQATVGPANNGYPRAYQPQATYQNQVPTFAWTPYTTSVEYALNNQPKAEPATNTPIRWSVPDSWQLFRVKDQLFYIVPASEVERMIVERRVSPAMMYPTPVRPISSVEEEGK